MAEKNGSRWAAAGKGRTRDRNAACSMQSARRAQVPLRRGLHFESCMLNFALAPERHATNDALAFTHRNDMVGGKILNHFRRTARPAYLQALGSIRGAESEVCAQVVLGQIARP